MTPDTSESEQLLALMSEVVTVSSRMQATISVLQEAMVATINMVAETLPAEQRASFVRLLELRLQAASQRDAEHLNSLQDADASELGNHLLRAARGH